MANIPAEHELPPFRVNGTGKMPQTLREALQLDAETEAAKDWATLCEAHRNPGLAGRTALPHGKSMVLPTDPKERKGLPICTGVLDYFPRALAEVARVSNAGNDQHNPGQPLHWDKTKSMDHADCIPRHLIDRFARDDDGQRHAAKLAWRALAFLEILLEQEATS